jgi:hypothetical protein
VKDAINLVGGVFHLAEEMRNGLSSCLSTYLALLQKFLGNGVSLLAPLLNHLSNSFRCEIEPFRSASRYSKEVVTTRKKRFERPTDLNHLLRQLRPANLPEETVQLRESLKSPSAKIRGSLLTAKVQSFGHPTIGLG